MCFLCSQVPQYTEYSFSGTRSYGTIAMLQKSTQIKNNTTFSIMDIIVEILNILFWYKESWNNCQITNIFSKLKTPQLTVSLIS